MFKDFTKLTKRKPAKAEEKEPVKQLPNPQKGDFGNPLTTIVMMLALFFGSQILAGLAVGLFAIGLGVSADEIGNWIADRPYAQFVYIFLAEAIAVGLLISWLRLRRLNLVDIGAGKPKKGFISRAILGFLAYFAILTVVIIILQAVLPGIFTDQEQNIGFEKITSQPELVVTFISLVILPPIGEEILVRGYLFTGLRSRLSFVFSMLITSALFAVAHLQLGSGEAALWAAGVNTFVLSVVLCYLRESTGTIWAGVIIHALNNLIAFNVRF